MTKEQKAIENLTDLLKQRNEKQVQITTYNLFENIETVLSMLKEKDAEIEKKDRQLEERNNRIRNLEKEAQSYFDGMAELNSELVNEKAKSINDSIKAKHKADTDLDDLNKGWQVELEKYKQLYNKALDDTVITEHDNIKQKKMIDLMAEELQKHIFVLYDGDTITSKKGIIQHYERKVNSSEQN